MKRYLTYILILFSLSRVTCLEIQSESSLLLTTEHNFNSINEGCDIVSYMASVAPKSFREYENSNFFELESDLYIGDYISFSFFPKVYFELDEVSSIELERLSSSILLLNGIINIEAGLFLPEYGVGYTKKNPTDLIAKVSNYRSRYLVNTQVYFENLNLEFCYGPGSSILSDDLTKDEENFDHLYLGRLSASLDIHSINFVYQNSKEHRLGFSYSSQIGDTVIPLLEAVWSSGRRAKGLEKSEEEYSLVVNDTPFLSILAGFSWAPYFMSWTLFCEFLYNGEGLSKREWNDFSSNLEDIGKNELLKTRYLPGIYQNIDFMNSSRYYLITHLKQSDSERFFDLLKIDGTLITVYPLGLYGNLEFELDLFDHLTIESSIGGVLYSEKGTELSYMKDNLTFGLSLSCSY